jgi:hypothetical protein
MAAKKKMKARAKSAVKKPGAPYSPPACDPKTGKPKKTGKKK